MKINIKYDENWRKIDKKLTKCLKIQIIDQKSRKNVKNEVIVDQKYERNY